ncbi:MAG: glutamine amidotransferase family protein [Candidatus Altiarchaeota archaeon]|nr:glutamine amidotransferase family protein [Candidatus Altiarchaeota archaeon]
MKKSFTKLPNMRDFSACAIGGIFNLNGKRIAGKKIRDMMAGMQERESGQGAGYAAYGLFPDLKDYYCLQLIMDDEEAKDRVEEFLNRYTDVIENERVKVREDVLKEYPIVWRFFVDPHDQENPDEAIKNMMMYINCSIHGAFALSGGKDMAVFKGNGWATEIADFYRIDRIKAYMWSAHSRFPTNTPGWWGGAHPFSIVGHAIVHNGEITSYGTNVNYLKEFGYECKLLTDTEVLAYIFDLIVRKSGYPPRLAQRIACIALSPPYWRDIDRLPEEKRRWLTAIRLTYRKAMANGPFSIIVTTNYPEPTMIGHSDRKKLRPLIAAISENGKTLYLSSELNAIHSIDKTTDFWQPDPGNPVVARLDREVIRGIGEPLEGLRLK